MVTEYDPILRRNFKNYLLLLKLQLQSYIACFAAHVSFVVKSLLSKYKSMIFQSLLMSGKSRGLWMPCMMSSRARNIEHGRKSTSQSWRSTCSSVLTSKRATSPKKASTNTRTSVNRLAIVLLYMEFPKFFFLLLELTIAKHSNCW